MKNILAGSWIAQRWEQKNNDNKWVLFMEASLKNFIWHFGPVKERAQGFHGKMIRVFPDSEPNPQNFSYFPADTKLYIEDPLEGNENERYRVVQQDDNELMLYVLENVHREPEDYVFRIVLRKIGQTSI